MVFFKNEIKTKEIPVVMDSLEELVLEDQKEHLETTDPMVYLVWQVNLDSGTMILNLL